MGAPSSEASTWSANSCAIGALLDLHEADLVRLGPSVVERDGDGAALHLGGHVERVLALRGLARDDGQAAGSLELALSSPHAANVIAPTTTANPAVAQRILMRRLPLVPPMLCARAP